MRRVPALGPRGEGWLAGQVVLFGLAFGVGLGTRGEWSGPAGLAATLAGVALMAAGGVLAFRGVVDLTPLPAPKRQGWLVDCGAYALVRHPIYSGIILGAFGWGLALGSLPALLVAAAIGLFFDLKSRREEFWLSEKYPGYPAYRQRTRKLVPWIY
jgi:protein-S-isoprenylcysteine O-methyltransferase Ste14